MFNTENRTEVDANEKYKQTTSNISDYWQYEFEPNKRIIYNGYEAYTESNSGDHYMGQSPRNNVEERNEDMRTYIGHRMNEDEVEDVYIDGKGMIRHTSLFGSSGYGKGCLLRNILIQTAYNGYGFSYIDPRGHNSKLLIQQLPDNRIDDIILIEPSTDEQFDLEEAIETDKIVILDTSSLKSESDRKLVTERFVSEVWKIIRNTDRLAKNKDYHLLCVDEFDKVLADEFEINAIISQARSFGLSVVLSAQHPRQLPEDVQVAMKQVQNVLSFNLDGNSRDLHIASNFINGIDARDISELDIFEVTGRIYMDKSKSEPVVFDVYREYPKLRSVQEAEQYL